MSDLMSVVDTFFENEEMLTDEERLQRGLAPKNNPAVKAFIPG